MAHRIPKSNPQGQVRATHGPDSSPPDLSMDLSALLKLYYSPFKVAWQIDPFHFGQGCPLALTIMVYIDIYVNINSWHFFNYVRKGESCTPSVGQVEARNKELFSVL